MRLLRQLRPAAGAFAEFAVAGGAALHVNLLAGLHRTLAGGRALPVGAHVDIPAGNLLRRGGRADPVDARRFFLLRQRRRCQ